MDWNAEVDKWDKLLHSEGVPDAERTRRIESLFNAYCQAEKAIREARASRSEMSAFVQKCRHIGTADAARDAGITPRAARKRITRFYKNGTVKPFIRFR